MRIDAAIFPIALAADGEGVRLSVSLSPHAIFLPWSELSVSGKRGWFDTVVRLRTSEVPGVTLVLNIDDAAADVIFRGALASLPERRLGWRPSRTVVLLVAIMAGLVCALVLLLR
jgi:hypothetical protein